MKKLQTWKFWLILCAEIVVATGIFLALSHWQERDMLQSNTVAPTLSAPALDGKTYQIPTANNNKRTLIYFFAPWCKVCDFSIGNLNILRAQFDESELDIIIVALAWDSQVEVEEFIARHDLDFPVLLGNQQWQEKYKVQGFPSYYVLDEQGEVLARALGYSSSIGMLRRIILD